MEKNPKISEMTFSKEDYSRFENQAAEHEVERAKGLEDHKVWLKSVVADREKKALADLSIESGR